MAWYKTGSVAVTLNNNVVTGTGTRFASNSRVGDGFNGPDGNWYEIINIASETVLTIYPAYQGVSVGSSTAWMIAPLQGYNKESADRLRAITDSISSVPVIVDSIFEKKFLKLAFIGDSLTQTSVRNNSWAKQVCDIIETLGDVEVSSLNAAINGSTFNAAINIKEHNNATKSQVERVIDFKPDVVFIALGVNDYVFSQSYTADQGKQHVLSIVSAIRAGSPNTKIIFAEEWCHDTSKGLIPTSLLNQDTVSRSHQTITLNGLAGVRINNATYNTTPIPAGKLAGHKTWGEVMTYARTLSDGSVIINLWLFNRMGWLSDQHHVTELAHTYWAWTVIRFLSNNSISSDKVNWVNLKIKDIDTNITTSIETAVSELNAGSIQGNSSSEYRGYTGYERLSGWMLNSRGEVLSTEQRIPSAGQVLTYIVTGGLPGSVVSIAVNGNSFVNINRTLDASGSFLATVDPTRQGYLSPLLEAGSHTVYIALTNSDGTIDAFERPLVVGSKYIPRGASSLYYLTSNFNLTLNANNYVQFNATDHDELGVGNISGSNPSSGLYIPSTLNGRKIKISANIRVNFPFDGTESNGAMLNLQIQKNRTAPPGNNVGRGLPAENRIYQTTSGSAQTSANDINMVSSIVTATTGDYYEVVVSPFKSSSGQAYVYPHTVTWFQIEVID